ncbi:MAG: ribosome biogenesis GTP-binding protein YihA/YsxC [Erysipelotrichaceae bacterium]|nr:ribosome biogenesis GTP-binding protein YihA/YsxC [Erysipelotrichaceae bacterium]
MIEFIKGAFEPKDFPPSQKEVVFVGRSNVGKSSMINALYNRRIAYVGKKPGKTVMLNFFQCDGGYTACDVPGYGFANRSQAQIVQFGKMMDAYFTQREALKLCVMIIDVRHKPTADDMDMLDYLKENRIPFLIVANKSDKLSNNQLVKAKKELIGHLNINDDELLCISANTGKNIDKLKDLILAAM